MLQAAALIVPSRVGYVLAGGALWQLSTITGAQISDQFLIEVLCNLSLMLHVSQ